MVHHCGTTAKATERPKIRPCQFTNAPCSNRSGVLDLIRGESCFWKWHYKISSQYEFLDPDTLCTIKQKNKSINEVHQHHLVVFSLQWRCLSHVAHHYHPLSRHHDYSHGHGSEYQGLTQATLDWCLPCWWQQFYQEQRHHCHHQRRWWQQVVFGQQLHSCLHCAVLWPS